jgi:hypothetical protein
LKNETTFNFLFLEKTCVACVAKKPDDSGADNIHGSGTFVLFLDRTNFKICKFEKRFVLFVLDYSNPMCRVYCKDNGNTFNYFLVMQFFLE